MDLIDKQGSESDESNCPTPTSHGVSSKVPNLKTCVDCGTSKTPLWRGGPAGPKSLCNACGIKSRKKRSAHQGIAKDEKKMNKKAKKSTAVIKQGNGNSQSSSNSSTICSEDSTTSNCSIGEKKTLWCSAFGGDASLQRPRSNSKRRSRKLKEEEQAALLLMAMSCGTVYS